jgi:hypothetical protein
LDARPYTEAYFADEEDDDSPYLLEEEEVREAPPGVGAPPRGSPPPSTIEDGDDGDNATVVVEPAEVGAYRMEYAFTAEVELIYFDQSIQWEAYGSMSVGKCEEVAALLEGSISISDSFDAYALIEVGCKQPNGSIPLSFELAMENWTPKRFPRMTLTNGEAKFKAQWQRSNATHTSGISFYGYVNASLLFQFGTIDDQGLPGAGMPSVETGEKPFHLNLSPHPLEHSIPSTHI